MIEAAIFDMDGLLFDTERLCCEAWRSVSRMEGWEMDDATFIACVGRNKKDTERIVREACGPDFPFERFDALAREWMMDRMKADGPPEKKGIRELFAYLASRNVPIALATSTSERSARQMIEWAGLTHWFSAWAFGSEVEKGKPEPDIFLLVKERLSVKDASRCVVFEDSVAGLTAALAAGMKAVFVRDMIDPEQALLDRVWKNPRSLDEAASDSFFGYY